MAENTTILAIESAIRGGSIALALGGEIIDTWLGEGGVSRAEDLLWNIDQMLKRNNITKTSLNQIAVSVGPGSFTGIRIGLATAMGLATALNIELAKYSILHAMAANSADSDSLTTAVPVGRGVFCKQTFRKNSAEIAVLTEPTAITDELFEHEIKNIEIITNETFARGLATCLIHAAIDPRAARATEPLFIPKPAHI